jgi:hypothetical protein
LRSKRAAKECLSMILDRLLQILLIIQMLETLLAWHYGK